MLDVDTRTLHATVAAVWSVAPEIRRQINAHTRSELGPVWTGELQRRARGPMDQRVLLRGARIKAGTSLALVAATSTRTLSGGLTPADEWAPVEFGGTRGKVTAYRRRSYARRTPTGTVQVRSGTVRRHTTRQLKPRNSRGWVVFPAVAEFGPRAASLWTATVVRTVYDAFDKGA